MYDGIECEMVGPVGDGSCRGVAEACRSCLVNVLGARTMCLRILTVILYSTSMSCRQVAECFQMWRNFIIELTEAEQILFKDGPANYQDRKYHDSFS